MVDLIAQTAGVVEAVPPWAALGGSVLGASFTVWYAWHTATRTIPTIIKEHREELSRVIHEFQDDVKAQRVDFLAALDKQNVFHERVMDRLEKKIAKAVGDSKGDLG